MKEGRDEVSRDWSAFSCPLCQVIFRFRVGTQPEKVECPGCLLPVDVSDSPAVSSLPVPGKKQPSRVGINLSGKTQDQRPAGIEFRKAEVGDGRDGMRRRRTRQHMTEENKPAKYPHWDLEGDAAFEGTARWNSWKVVLVGGVFTAVVVWGAMALFLGFLSDRQEERNADTIPASWVSLGGVTQEVSGVSAQDIRVSDVDPDIASLSEVVETFLGATTLDQLLSVTIEDRFQEDKIREYYQTRELTPIEPKEIAPSGRVVKSGDLWSVDIVFADYSRRPITLRKGAEGYRVDWESWVAYSEMTWAQIRETRPLEPVTFRVVCSKAQYYNYGFMDEGKWASFRLESLDRDHMLYGYVVRNSEEEKRLLRFVSEGGSPRAFILRLRFIEESGPNQVIIDEVVSTGWSRLGSRSGFPDLPTNSE